MTDNPHNLAGLELAHRDASASGGGDYPPEAIVSNSQNGFQLRTAAAPLEIDYVRVCDPDGGEIAYWTTDELREDPADVVGAIMGAIVRGGR